MAVDFNPNWKAIRPKNRKWVKGFLRDTVSGDFETSVRDILRAAKGDFGDSPDWEAIKALIIQYLPILLSFLK